MGMSVRVTDMSAPTIADRRALASEAMRASIDTRMRTGMDLVSPACVYAMADALGVRVTFNAIDMEGMYQKGRPPRKVSFE